MGHNQSHRVNSNNGSRRSSPSDTEPVQPVADAARLPQIDKLAKILVQKTLSEENVSGIKSKTFAKYVFPAYQDIAGKLFGYFVTVVGSVKGDILSEKEFVLAVENFFAVITDELQVEMYLKMYGENGTLTPDSFRELLLAAYKITVDHYSGGPASCHLYSRTIQSVVDATFHQKKSLSQSFLCQWILSNCPRLTGPLHRYIVHILSTSYRHVGVQEDESSGLELSTPVLDREPNFSASDVALLSLSQVWLLAVSLPQLYIQPSPHHSPVNSSNGLTSQNVIAKLMGSVCPSHWAPLYRSNEHGLGANRFIHHVTNYRGPTLLVMKCELEMQFCIASSMEWKETHQYWGGNESVVLQLLPEFHCLACGPKLLFFNDSIRGFPRGIRAGPDPKSPIIDINHEFSKVTYRGAPYNLLDLEMWGCGPEQTREAQLDVKKWQVKDAERNRKVKIRAEDWVDNPDRYLLELAGRPTYSEQSQ